MMDTSKKHDKPSPFVKANFFSKMFFWWLKDLLLLGYSRDVEVEDLYNTLPQDDSTKLGDRLERKWSEETTRKSPNLRRAILRTFWTDALGYSILYLLYSCLFRVGQALFLCFLIDSFRQDSTNTSTRVSYALGLLSCSLGCAISFAHFICRGNECGMRIRVAVCSLMYRKVLRQSRSRTQDSAPIQVANLLANDVTRFDEAPVKLTGLYTPLQVIIVTACAWSLMGISAVIGVLTLILFTVPLQIFFGHLSGVLRLKVAEKTDKRVQLLGEIIAGIQLIKMYAWETPFFKMVQAIRKSEMQSVLHANYVRGNVLSSVLISDRIALVFTLLPYILLGNDITAAKVYAVAEMYNAMKLGLAYYLPVCFSTIGECKVSIERIQKFLLQEEKEVSRKQDDEVLKKGVVVLDNVSTGWVPHVDVLSNISLDIRPGTLCAVVGHTGAGKSSLLQTLLGELPLRQGSMSMSGTVSFCSQDPWLFSATIRRNILFGQEYEEQHYNEVLKVCALERDLRYLPQGDGTLVGEKGTALSGGQRARINLARAVYRKADIYLFDNPLAAVDTQVARQVLNECICGFLKDTTRILVVHQPQFIKQADLIISLNKGCIEDVGSYQEMLGKSEALSQILDSTDELASGDQEDIVPEKLESREEEVEKASDENGEESETAELLARGRVDKKVYSRYFLAGSSVFRVVMMVAVFVIGQGLVCATDMWTAYWTNQEDLRRTLIPPVTSLPAFLPPLQNTSQETPHQHTPRKNMTASENILRASEILDTLDMKYVLNNLKHISHDADHPLPASLQGWNTTTSTITSVIPNTLIPISEDVSLVVPTEEENTESVEKSSSSAFSFGTISTTFTNDRKVNDLMQQTNTSTEVVDDTKFGSNESSQYSPRTKNIEKSSTMDASLSISRANETKDFLDQINPSTPGKLIVIDMTSESSTSPPIHNVTELAVAGQEITENLKSPGHVGNSAHNVTKRDTRGNVTIVHEVNKELSKSELIKIHEEIVKYLQNKSSEASVNSMTDVEEKMSTEATQKMGHKGEETTVANIIHVSPSAFKFPTVQSLPMEIRNSTSGVDASVLLNDSQNFTDRGLNVFANLSSAIDNTDNWYVSSYSPELSSVPQISKPGDSATPNNISRMLLRDFNISSAVTPGLSVNEASSNSSATSDNISGMLSRNLNFSSSTTPNLETRANSSLNHVKSPVLNVHNSTALIDKRYPYFNATRRDVSPGDEEQMSSENFLWIYASFVGITLVMVVWRTNFYMEVLARSSKGLHKNMLSSVLNSPMKFFDANPSGRIMNRFTKDLGTVDEGIPFVMFLALQNITVAIGIVIVVATQNSWTLIPFLLAAGIFWKMSQLYLATADDVRRLEGITRSPVFSHLAATVDGLATIRASGMSQLLRHEFDSLQNQHTAAWTLTISTGMFLNLWADLTCTFFMACIIVLFLLVADDMPSGAVGLALSQTLVLLGMTSMGITMSTVVANMMVSVERLVQYTELEPEPGSEPGAGQKPPTDWPALGELKIKNLDMSYSRGGPLILHDVNLNIRPGEKIGVVGRTGAGKSSLAIALLRMAYWRGSIEIDREDISRLSLKELRQNISIIPQKPVLFSAPVRVNLDPAGTVPDIELWEALAQVELKGAVPSLDMALSEAGSNLSMGQRQLLCLARVILRRNKIVILDEATANIDLRTDALIQQSISEQFKDCTVLSITHRLNNVMEAHRVLVLDEGHIVEFDHPHVLLQDSNGFLSKLFLNMDESTATPLRQMAAEAYKELQSRDISSQRVQED